MVNMPLPSSVAGSVKVSVMPGGRLAIDAATACSAMGLRLRTVSVPLTDWPGIRDALMPPSTFMPRMSKLSCGVPFVVPGYTALMV